jgi:hypothetical protein
MCYGLLGCEAVQTCMWLTDLGIFKTISVFGYSGI